MGPATRPSASVFRDEQSWRREAYGTGPCPLCVATTRPPVAAARPSTAGITGSAAADAQPSSTAGIPSSPSSSSSSAPLGLDHVLLHCSHPAVLAARQRALLELPRVVSNICLRLAVQQDPRRLSPVAHARGSPLADRVRALGPHTARVQDALEHVDWQSPDGLFATYHILLAATWDPSALRQTPAGTSQALSSALADLFSRTTLPNHQLRGAANLWFPWAARTNFRIISAWAGAIDREVHSWPPGTPAVPPFTPPVATARPAQQHRMQPMFPPSRHHQRPAPRPAVGHPGLVR